MTPAAAEPFMPAEGSNHSAMTAKSSQRGRRRGGSAGALCKRSAGCHKLMSLQLVPAAMQNHLRSRSRTDRLVLIDEEDKASSPSYFQWREQTITTKAFKPAPQPQPKANSLVRLFRRFA